MSAVAPPLTPEQQDELNKAMSELAGLPVVKLDQYREEQKIKMLIYGQPGVGKTVLAGSSVDVEAMRPVLFVDVEGGTLSLYNFWQDIHVVRPEPLYSDKGRLLKTKWQRLVDIYEDIKKGGLYKTVVIDSLSEAYHIAMSDVMTDVVMAAPDRDPDVPAIRDWGKVSTQVRRLVRQFRDLDTNVIFTAHERMDVDNDGKVVIAPSFPGKLAHEVSGFMDEVLYLYTKTKKDGDKQVTSRLALTANAGKYVAKDRSGKLEAVLENPTMPKIITAIGGK